MHPREFRGSMLKQGRTPGEDKKGKPMTVTVEALLQGARQETGLKDYGDDWFMGPLQAYVADLDGAHLSEWGKAFLVRLVAKDLSRRLAIVDCLNKNPEIEDVPIPPIVYITGHERSGTTLLHNLMSQHSGARSLSRWELMMPTPPPVPGSLLTDPRHAVVQKSADALRGTDLEYMHWVDAHDPEECPWGFMDCTGLLGMAPTLIMPNWMEWIYSNDMTPTLKSYRKVIQLLTWKNPVPEGGFLVLKAPQMSRFLPGFLTVFPETNFVYIHRDPYRVFRSFCTLIDIVNSSFLEDRDYIFRIEKEKGIMMNRMCALYDDLERFEVTHGESVHNVDYATLVDAPESEVARLYSELGRPKDSQLEQGITGYLDRQKSGGRARPRQDFLDFGYSRESVMKTPGIAHYIDRYKVTIEASRKTGA